MPKTWILDSETKGTGAHMVPIEQTLRRGGGEPELSLVELGGPSRQPAQESPPGPLRFKVVDVMSSRVLADGVSAAEAVRALRALRSFLDARVSVRAAESDRWRLLPMGQVKTLWALREQLACADDGDESSRGA